MAGTKRRKRTHTKDQREVTEESNDTTESAPLQYESWFTEVEVPFRIHLPTPYQYQSTAKSKKAGRKSTGSGRKSNGAAANPPSLEQNVEQSSFDESLTLSYTVQGAQNPKDKVRADWYGPEMRSYQSFQAGDVMYRVGELVYVKAPDSEAPGESDGTEYNYDDCWIAQILEIKALDANHVYVRIFWMYRPDDTPGGRQSHHADGEFVPSNDMQIINAETVNGKPQHWQLLDEADFMNYVTGYKDLVYRQTYNFMTHQATPSLRKICRCNTPANPDFPPVHCGNEKCDIWLHPGCIANDIFKRVEDRWKGEKKGKVNGKVAKAEDDGVKLSNSSLWNIPLGTTTTAPSEGQLKKARNLLSSRTKTSESKKRKRELEDEPLDPSRVQISFVRDTSIHPGMSTTDTAAAKAKAITSTVKRKFGLPTQDGPSKKTTAVNSSNAQHPPPIMAQIKIYKDGADDAATAPPAQKPRKANGGKRGQKVGKKKGSTSADTAVDGDPQEDDGEVEDEVVKVFYESLKCLKCGEGLRRQEGHVFLDGRGVEDGGTGELAQPNGSA